MALRLPRNPALPGLAGLDRDALGIRPSSIAAELCCPVGQEAGPVSGSRR
jgi:hypothetical protein